jgi:hypothetical protein
MEKTEIERSDTKDRESEGIFGTEDCQNQFGSDTMLTLERNAERETERINQEF